MTAFARTSLFLLVVPLALATVTGCGPGNVPLDDAGDGSPGLLLPVLDGGLPPPDAGDGDSGPPGTDGGTPDDGGPGLDGGTPTDAGGTDAGGTDAGVPVVLTSAEGGPCYEAAGAVCSAGLVCAPYYLNGAGTCARPCAVSGQTCGGGGTCTEYGSGDTAALICATVVPDGAGCDVEQLVTCAGEGLCFIDDDQPLGGTCRTPCSCATGTSCSSSACAGSTCVITDVTEQQGFCGSAAQLGQACDPVSGGVFCEGNASCLLDALGGGTCHARCETPGTADPACAGNSACFGAPGDGFCLPTTNLGQGETCTDGTTTPIVPVTCAAGFACVHDPDVHGAGFGACLEDCSSGGNDACETGRCFDLEPSFPGAGLRCVSDVPRGGFGCGGLQGQCEVGGVCVTLADESTICKQRCTLAAPTECTGGETCVSTFLASTEDGVCGALAGQGEVCDLDDDVYCAPAPGQDVETNAFATCVGTCHFVCRLPSTPASDPDLACPSGMECRVDPAGRLNDTVRVCVDVP